MNLESDLRNTKYRNWVRGVLAYKYLKCGLKGFADYLVVAEHQRILSAHRNTCNQCNFRDLKPVHKKDLSSGRSICPRSQNNCNCLRQNKIPCPNNFCDAVFEDILNSHGSTPPAPNWKNTDVQKWCSSPWEIAKCFINAPGYTDKSSATDIDASGLLHLFINNTNFHSHMTCVITGSDCLSKTRQRRNGIFHSPEMELEENEMIECIDDIISILEDDQELKARPEAKQAVVNLLELKQRHFVISTHEEAEACRSALDSITKEAAKIKSTVDEARNDIKKGVEEALQNIDEKSKKATENALDRLEKKNDSQIETMKQTIEVLVETVKHLKSENAVIIQRLTDIDTTLDTLKATRDKCVSNLKYVEQKQVFQRELFNRYEKFYQRTSVSPLKTNEDDINISQVYVNPLIKQEKKVSKNTKITTHTETTTSVLYERQTNTKNDTKATTHSRDKTSECKVVNGYKDIFHNNESRYKRIYIVGDAGTGKSSFSKMMIHNWCTSYRETEKLVTGIENIQHPLGMALEEENIKEMKFFKFLFFIPLSRMSGFSIDVLEMIKEMYKDILSNDLICTLFEKESHECCILIDGLDEWTPPKNNPCPQHVSYGIPNGSGLKNATFVTFSRPSAKGILNLKSSEYDMKINLQGVDKESVEELASNYMKLQNRNNLTVRGFMGKIRDNFEHVDLKPLLIQQLVWMFCQEKELGTCVPEVNCNLVNILFGWNQSKDENDSTDEDTVQYRAIEDMELPDKLRQLPRCQANKSSILSLGKLAFDELTADTSTCIFGRLKLLECGFSKNDINLLTRTGFIEEQTKIDPSLETTSFTFIHRSYLEFFAAIYVTSFPKSKGPPPCKARRLSKQTALHEFFTAFKSIADILRMSKVVETICYLAPNLLREITEHVYEVVHQDVSFVDYRKTLPHNDIREPEMIQMLLEDWALYCDDAQETQQTTLSLSDITINIDTNLSFLHKIDPEKVLSLCSYSLTYLPEDVCKWIALLHHLQVICIFTEEISCEELDNLFESIEKLVSLQELIMYDRTYNNPDMIGPICNNLEYCPTHILSLTNHNKLVRIHFEKVCCFEIDCEKLPINLESLFIMDSFGHDSSDYHEELCKLVPSAKNLKHLTLATYGGDEYDDHSLDLSQNTLLQTVNLNYFVCCLGSAENVKSLVSFSISESNLKHEAGDKLASALSSAVSLKSLSISEIKCDGPACKKHQIDLSQHGNLEVVEMIACCFYVVNSKVSVRTSYPLPSFLDVLNDLRRHIY
ncbi:uncharacterized protein LOC132727867 [Ruditapes philippinarum]|uniref:uncharacterized protein LOC132727867 n=1 Tax=Ruditapes philippinarum TaxID=129788 RepID=UPI00295AF9DF|nr:uncharacterized protein LOC132727867 [Ruditapes philippinarum]